MTTNTGFEIGFCHSCKSWHNYFEGDLKGLDSTQLALLPKVRGEWIDFFNSLEFDEVMAKSFVDFCYELCGFGVPVKVVLDSPMSLQVAANMIKNKNQVSDQVGSQVESQVRGQVWGQVRGQVSDQVTGQVRDQVVDQVVDQVSDQVRDQVGSQVWDQAVNQVSDQVWDQVGDQVWGQVSDQVRSQVESQVSGQVSDQVRSQVRSQVWDQVSDQVSDQVWGQVSDQVGSQVGNLKIEYVEFTQRDMGDAGWVSFYDYFQRIGIVKNKKFDTYKKLLKSGIFSFIALKETAFISKPPIFLNRDEEGRMHSTHDYAIMFKDGWGLHYVHGVHFNKKEFTSLIQKKPTSKEVLKIDNVEKRMAVLEVHGYDLLLKEAEIINEYDTFQRKATEIRVICPTHGTVKQEHWGLQRQGDVLLVRKAKKTCMTCKAKLSMKVSHDQSRKVRYELYHMKDKTLPFKLLKGEWWEAGKLRSFVETVPETSNNCRESVARSFKMREQEYWDNLIEET